MKWTGMCTLGNGGYVGLPCGPKKTELLDKHRYLKGGEALVIGVEGVEGGMKGTSICTVTGISLDLFS